MSKYMRLMGGVVSVAVIFLLTGCTPEARIEATLVDGRITFIICDPIQVQHLSVDASMTRGDSYLKTVWRASGGANWPAGQLLSYGVTPVGFTDNVAPTSIEKFHGYALLVLNSPDEGDPQQTLQTRSLSFDLNLLKEGKWLSGHGQISSSPCK
jgi:hypothetical protein